MNGGRLKGGGPMGRTPMKGYGRGDKSVTVNRGRVSGDMGPMGAVGELYKEHPHNYDQHGPFHGTTDHDRHKAPVKPNPEGEGW